MIVKLIICDVRQSKREQFADGQRAWNALAKVAGFRGQSGGWSVDDSNRAIITAYWRDQSAYDRFMRDEHDAIFNHNAQKGTYLESDITLWHQVCDIPGSLGAFPQAFCGGGWIWG